MSNLWTNYEQESLGQVDISPLRFHFGIVAQSFLPSCFSISLFSCASNCSPLIRRFVGFVSGLAGKPRLCWIMSNSWTTHEQFMNEVGLTVLANILPETTKLGKSLATNLTKCCSFSRIAWTVGLWTLHEQFMNSSWTLYAQIQIGFPSHPCGKKPRNLAVIYVT